MRRHAFCLKQIGIVGWFESRACRFVDLPSCGLDVRIDVVLITSEREEPILWLPDETPVLLC